MSRLINFSNFASTKTVQKEITIPPSVSNYSSQRGELKAYNSYKLTVEVLVNNYPNKILFSIKDAAEVLGVGAEFIRRRIKSGKIKATYLGDKPFINIVELARISTEGV